ncbi:MAG: HAD hydrolase family protein [Chloroflexi bacterium]|nr:HAD hydrolase family protein [Chloroflexota bacterium]
MANFIAFDLEGPLSPRDNAYELMKLFHDGEKVFEVISRYDDLLTLEGREGYEPGDTLSLIVPFLALHNINEERIAAAAEVALTPGAEELVTWLEANAWKVFAITTAYEQYALRVTQRLGIFAHNVACTSFPIDEISQALEDKDRALLQQAEADILSLYPPRDDERIRRALDGIFLEKLAAIGIGQAIAQIKPVGGSRKVEALTRFADRYGEPLSRWVVVGDSITDFRMFQAVEAAGGLAVAFNANQYALPYATMGLASASINDLAQVLPAWHKGLRKEMEKVVRDRETAGGKDDRGYFHWLAGRKDIKDIIELHLRIRRVVREEAGGLG